jgi:NADP-dependent 3-hydroxy acid dehydrogenase YdfG
MNTGNGSSRRVAVVTGASAGIGAATARLLARQGFLVVAAARRVDRMTALGDEIEAHQLDVTDPASVAALASALEMKHGKVDVLVNSAGIALGNSYLADTDEEHWTRVFDTNVFGVVRVTRALIPLLKKAPYADIVNIGSIAGFDNYPGGGSYVASKHALRAITNELRLELNGEPIRVSEVGPGMTRTEFSDVRFAGDKARIERIYDGMTPLSPEDIAECVAFIVTRPPHVNVDYVVVHPLDQASAMLLHRNKLHRRKKAEAAP